MNNTMNNTPSIPTPIEKAVEAAKATKESYERHFQEELLAQIASFLDNLPYHELANLNKTIIKIKYSPYEFENHHNQQIYCTSISLGKSKEIIIDSWDALLTDCRNINLSSKDIYVGLTNAYNALAEKILSGEKIPGLKARNGVFKPYYLMLSI